MKKVLVLVAVFALVSCNSSFDGSLNVENPMTFKSGKKLVRLSTGEKPASIEMKSKRKFNLVFKKSRSQDLKIKFKLPRGFEFPKGESVSFSTTTNQGYSVQGTVDTQKELSELIRVTEVCQIMLPGSGVCHEHPEHGSFCDPMDQVAYGKRDVEYKIETTLKTVVLDFIKAGTIDARFNGVDVSKRRVYEYTGICRF